MPLLAGLVLAVRQVECTRVEKCIPCLYIQLFTTYLVDV